MTSLNRDCWTVIFQLVSRPSLWRLRSVNRQFYSLALQEINRRGYLIKPKYQYEFKLNEIAERYFHLDLSSTTGGIDYTNEDKCFGDYNWKQYGNLSNLQSLCLYNNKKRGEGYLYLTSVTQLDLNEAVILPEYLLAFTRLRQLNCTSLAEEVHARDSFPPEVIGQLTQLEILTTNSPAYDLIDIAALTRLKQLDLCWADCQVPGILVNFCQLEKLALEDIRIPSEVLFELVSLPYLIDLTYIEHKHDLHWSPLSQLTQLVKLRLIANYSASNGPGPGNHWPQLKKLTAKGINLTGINLSSLIKLDMCDVNWDPQMWRSLTSLRCLTLDECQSQVTNDDLEQLGHLNKLSLVGDVLVDSAILKLPELRTLGFYYTSSISELTWRNLTQLRHLNNITWSQLHHLPPEIVDLWISQDKVKMVQLCPGIPDYKSSV